MAGSSAAHVSFPELRLASVARLCRFLSLTLKESCPTSVSVGVCKHLVNILAVGLSPGNAFNHFN